MDVKDTVYTTQCGSGQGGVVATLSSSSSPLSLSTFPSMCSSIVDVKDTVVMPPTGGYGNGWAPREFPKLTISFGLMLWYFKALFMVWATYVVWETTRQGQVIAEEATTSWVRGAAQGAGEKVGWWAATVALSRALSGQGPSISNFLSLV